MTSGAHGARLVDVGAVIVTHNAVTTALQCATAIAADIDPKNVAVVINDPAGAPADVMRQLEQLAGQVVLNGQPLGYGANLNAGVARLPDGPRYLLLLNDDAFVQSGAVAFLRQTLAEHPGAALVGPRLVDEEGRAQPSRHRFPTLASELVAALLLPASIKAFLARRYLDVREVDAALGDAWPVGAALLVRSDAFQEVGGFDERYFLYSEETDLAWRLRARGWAIRFCDEAVVTHAGAQSTEGRHQRLLGLSRWRYVRSHWAKPTVAALVVLLPVVYCWNALYVGLRVLLAPATAREKAAWWYATWVKRPVPDLRLS